MKASSAGNTAVLLVGHGAPAKDCPHQMVSHLKRLAAARQPVDPPTAQERELDDMIRHWPRTETNDPYKTGLESIAAALGKELKEIPVLTAYGEFCTPSIEEAILQLARSGAKKIVVTTTMMTRGSMHSEKDIPGILKRLRAQHKGVKIVYAWPFPPASIAHLLAAQVRRRL